MFPLNLTRSTSTVTLDKGEFYHEQNQIRTIKYSLKCVDSFLLKSFTMFPCNIYNKTYSIPLNSIWSLQVGCLTISWIDNCCMLRTLALLNLVCISVAYNYTYFGVNRHKYQICQLYSISFQVCSFVSLMFTAYFRVTWFLIPRNVHMYLAWAYSYTSVRYVRPYILVVVLYTALSSVSNITYLVGTSSYLLSAAKLILLFFWGCSVWPFVTLSRNATVYRTFGLRQKKSHFKILLFLFYDKIDSLFLCICCLIICTLF